MPNYKIEKRTDKWRKVKDEYFSAPGDYQAEQYVLGMLKFIRGCRAIGKNVKATPIALYKDEKNDLSYDKIVLCISSKASPT